MSQLPESAPLSPEQRQALDAALSGLSPDQQIWLSGFLAGRSQGAGAAPAGSAPVAAAAPAAPKVPLTVLFGSESGNAESCAETLGKEARKKGFDPKVIDMGDYDFGNLGKEENLLVVVSTWGDGDPPDRATGFYENLMSDAAPELKNTRFSVCGLGDTAYEQFCQMGKDFDRRLGELGADRIHQAQECDVEFEEPFEEWMNGVLPVLVEKTGAGSAPAATAQTAAPTTATEVVAPPAEQVETAFNKKNPFPATLKERILLNGRGSAKETLHLEFDLAGSGLSYKVGDALGVIPANNPEVVEDMIRQAGFRGDELIEVDGDYQTIIDHLMTEFDVTGLSKSMLKKYAPMAKNRKLDKLLADDNKDALSDYLWGREIRDMFADFPPKDMSVDQFFGLLRKIPPRLYSIASSLLAHPEEVHLTVAVVRYQAHGRDRGGVCSTHFADRVAVGETMPVYIHPNKSFFLPEDGDTPIIMIGPGTGIAPFRAFVEERDALGSKGKNWLFFGDQHLQTDFLYQTEWQNYLKSGILTRMDVAFSRDQEHKVYVQDRMREKGRDLYAWLEDGAYFYVCGDASRMAKDVHEALINVVEEHGGKSRDDAEAYVKALQKERRYQRDVY
ncbi:MAG: assimilatory sulfite reductase (NADPH) flavoprotein subunit [Opitutales bacterium]